MPDALIVSTARSPIDRANKASLKDMRPDDLTVQMIRAALDKVPALDPKDIDDLYLGYGLNSAQTHDKTTGLITMCVVGGQGMGSSWRG